MHIGLIDSSNRRITMEHSVPLGLLSIGAIAESLGHKAELVQLDQFMLTATGLQNWESQIEMFYTLIAKKRFDILGFTTRADTLPIVMAAAEKHKAIFKDVPIVLGGPGASFVDQQIINIFPYIDIVVRGEGENTFAELLCALEQQEDLRNINGITFRGRYGEVIRTLDRAMIPDLDDIPDAAFHLMDEWLRKPETLTTNILAGRGCLNGCSFCSTCALWGKSIRMRSAKRVVAEMKMLHETYGIRFFQLDHDNLLANTHFVMEFCKLVQEDIPEVKWTMSTSLSLCTPEKVEMVAQGGCVQVFAGIETASDKMAKNIFRKFRTPSEIYDALELFRKHNIQITKSYIIGFPDETIDDINSTLDLAIDLQSSMHLGHLEGTQIHPLVINPGTELYEKHGHSLSYIGVIGDSTDHMAIKIKRCVDLCKTYPSIFTAYASHKKKSESKTIVELCNFYRFLSGTFSKSLFVALRELEISPVAFVQYFKEYSCACGVDFPDIESNISRRDPAGNYMLSMFPQVLAKLYEDANRSQDFVQLFLTFEQPLLKVFFENNEYTDLYSGESPDDDSILERTPVVPKTTVLLSLTYDPIELLSEFRLTGQTFIPSVGNKEFYVFYLPSAAVKYHMPWTYTGLKMNEIAGQITSWITKLADGKRSSLEIVNEIFRSLGTSATSSVRKTIVDILTLLIQREAVLLLPQSQALTKEACLCDSEIMRLSS
jgi:radical SAM superfamily enzyme YgiQ (UPF0313 family)